MTSSFSHMVSVLRVLFRVPLRSKVFSPVPVCVAPCKLKRFSESDAFSSDRKLRKGSHESVMAELKKKIEAEIRDSHVLVYSKTTCPFCKRVKNLFGKSGIDAAYVEVDVVDNGADIQDVLADLTGQRSVPNVFVNGRHVGGCDKTIEEFSNGSLARKIIEGQMQRDAFDPQHNYDYDLVVIGGGSGGLACGKEAAKQGARVACLDFVQPTPQGTSWGLGGTCVNVGCIPKKLMHQAALLGHSLEDSRAFGWETPEKVGHSWGTLVKNIQDHIGSLNWGYRVQLRDKNVKYINACGEFIDAHTVKHVNKRGKEDIITSARFVVAVGGRPRYPDIPGAKEYGITSDDLFSLGYPPGKTLCIGASYVSLECAGFLAAYGFDTTVMVRSILLRGFDQQMAELVGKYMENHSVKFKRGFVPTKIELIEEGTPRKLRVHFKEVATGEEKSEEFNTVLFAIGRDPTTKTIGLEKAGVQYDKNGFIPAIFEQTNVPHIYALGDVLKGKLELTPLAIHAGKLLSQRLFGGKSLNTEYMYVPTTVFTPLEYGCCGLPEEDAKMIYGEQNIEVYHAYFQPLEWTVPHREDNACYGKLVVNKADNERVLAFHLVGPNAGEITQGYAVAIRTRATKLDFDATIGIHPTITENFTTMDRTKSSGEDPMVTGC